MMRREREGSGGMEMCSSCLRGVLKLFNFLLAFVGLALSLFSIWHLCKFFDLYDLQERPHPLIFSLQWNLPDAWFLYFLFGLGLFLCFISLIGHVATETSNGCCLSSYIFFLVLLFILEGAFAAEVCLNKNWEEIIPDDPSGLFDYMKEFVEYNLNFCKWVGLALVIIEVFALLLAFCTRAAMPSSRFAYYDSDECTLTPNTGTVEGWPINR
ncbi:hypothetical protein L7F22_035902 [Adiantum nelumboides]|nr:hypothetical protein [Adiantum nelumboides]